MPRSVHAFLRGEASQRLGDGLLQRVGRARGEALQDRLARRSWHPLTPPPHMGLEVWAMTAEVMLLQVLKARLVKVPIALSEQADSIKDSISCAGLLYLKG